MGSLMSEDTEKKWKRVIVELVRGKEMALQLQTLLEKPGGKDDWTVLVEDLALKILKSFTETLSVLSSCAVKSTQIAAIDSEKKVGIRDRRGRYKRRRSCDSWMTTFPAMEDGYAWRKYGQKDIFNSEFPRCYFRCSQKYKGCKATKQVQKIRGDPILYQTTYFNHHSCTHVPRAPPPIVDPDPAQPDPLGSQMGYPYSKQDNPMIMKEESKDQGTQSEDISNAKSSLDPWMEVVGPGSFACRTIWGSYQEDGSSACGFTTLHELDTKVNQLGDIENLHFDDIF